MTATTTRPRPPIESATEAPPARTAAVLAPAAVLATGQLYLGIPLASSIADDWGVSSGAATGAITTFGIAYGVGVIVFGLLIDRLGARRVMTVGMLLAGVATIAVAVAGNLTTGYLLRAGQGLAMGAFPPAAFTYIGARIPANRRAVAMSCLTGGFLAAGAIAQLGAQGIAAIASWRAVFVVSGVLLGAAALAVHLTLLPDGPAAHRRFVPLRVDGRMIALFGAGSTILIAFVGLYTALQLHTDMSTAALGWLRLVALPAVVVMPFVIGRIRLAAPLRAAVGLSVVAAVATATAALGDGDTAILVVALFVLTLGVALSAPSLAESVAVASAEARALGTGIFTAGLMFGASATAPVVAALGGLPAAALLAGGITAAGAGAALAAIRLGRE